MRIIFYHPAPIKENATSASGIRPAKMLNAFRTAGFEVDEVCGFGAERKVAINAIKKKVNQGIHYAFAYGENTTLPFALNEPSHFPLYPFLDYSFWYWLKQHNIPFGCFYRDFYWRFPEFRKGIAFHKWSVPLPFHFADIAFLTKTCTKLFLPSEGVASYLPFKNDKKLICALPPGCDEIADNSKDTTSYLDAELLNVFYVGGITPPNYDLSPMFDFFSQPKEKVNFTLCCREQEWLNIMKNKNYLNFNSEAINIIHKSGDELSPYWSSASVFLSLWGETPYHDFGAPFKFYEALGHGIPIITTRGTAAGDFVDTQGFGWAIEPTAHALASLMDHLLHNPALIKEKKERIRTERHKHTWTERARFAATVLMGETEGKGENK
ncbi:MAG: glycosyltransferase [Clostridiaceae bacterium]|nr:glycosyltransferase [Clostridiaceae bacterium]